MPLSSRQQQIFQSFLEAPESARSVGDFAYLDLGRTTLFRDLKGLVHEGLLQLEGKSYRVNEGSDAYIRWELSRRPELRHEVRYDPQLLAAYQPNVTALLAPGQLEVLAQAGPVPGLAEAHDTGKMYERVLRSLLIDLTHASSNLENVNISWLDTKTLIEFGERPDGLTDAQLRIVTNHKQAIAHLGTHRESLAICKRDLMDLHTLVTEPGALRTVVVKLEDSRYLPPDNPHQLREAFEEFCAKAQAIENPWEQAFFTMLFVPYLQPFRDGNKRTSRLAMNIPLVRRRLAPFSFADIRRRDYLFGLLAFYERGRHQFLASAFTEAYVKSAGRYAELIAHVNAGGLLSTLS